MLSHYLPAKMSAQNEAETSRAVMADELENIYSDMESLFCSVSMRHKTGVSMTLRLLVSLVIVRGSQLMATWHSADHYVKTSVRPGCCFVRPLIANSNIRRLVSILSVYQQLKRYKRFHFKNV